MYLNSIRTAKRQLRTARSRRHIAYNLDLATHGEAELVAPGVYRYFPYPSHAGYPVDAAALSIGPRVQPQGRPY